MCARGCGQDDVIRPQQIACDTARHQQCTQVRQAASQSTSLTGNWRGKGFSVARCRHAEVEWGAVGVLVSRCAALCRSPGTTPHSTHYARPASHFVPLLSPTSHSSNLTIPPPLAPPISLFPSLSLLLVSPSFSPPSPLSPPVTLPFPPLPTPDLKEVCMVGRDVNHNLHRHLLTYTEGKRQAPQDSRTSDGDDTWGTWAHGAHGEHGAHGPAWHRHTHGAPHPNPPP